MIPKDSVLTGVREKKFLRRRKKLKCVSSQVKKMKNMKYFFMLVLEEKLLYFLTLHIGT